MDPMKPEFVNKAFSEVMPVEVLKWQGSVPDEAQEEKANMDGDVFRATSGKKGGRPFVFGFIPSVGKKI